VFLTIELDDERPIYQQIRDQIVVGIASGELEEGSALPSIRQLAVDFGINMHTVNRAYEMLQRDGFVRMRRKTGAVVHVTRAAALADLPSWETRQRILLAEALGRGISASSILQHVQKLLGDFETSHYEQMK